MNENKIKDKRRIGIALAIFLVVRYLIAGLFSWLATKFNIVNSNNLYILSLIINAVTTYGFAYLVFKLIIKKAENAEIKEKKKLKFGELIILVLVTLGVTYAVSYVTNIITRVIQAMSGYEINNSVQDLLKQINPLVNGIFVVVLGPIFEELIFRGTLLKKLRVYGDKTAIIYTAIAFGLFHTNINQIAYAIACGVVFGYVVTKTNNIKYSIFLHMLLNSIQLILTILLQTDMNYIIGIFGLLVIGLILFNMIFLPIRLTSGKVKIQNESKYDKGKLYANWGYILFVVVVILLTVEDLLIHF